MRWCAYMKKKSEEPRPRESSLRACLPEGSGACIDWCLYFFCQSWSGEKAARRRWHCPRFFEGRYPVSFWQTPPTPFRRRIPGRLSGTAFWMSGLSGYRLCRTKKCHCFLKAIIDLFYTQSNLKGLLEQENFEHFNFDYYSSNYRDRLSGQNSRELATRLIRNVWISSTILIPNMVICSFLGILVLGRHFSVTALQKKWWILCILFFTWLPLNFSMRSLKKHWPGMMRAVFYMSRSTSVICWSLMTWEPNEIQTLSFLSFLCV